MPLSYHFDLSHSIHGSDGVYELVQVKRRMSPAPSTRMSHVWCHADRHEEWKRVTSPVFCSGPRTGSSGENVSPPTTGLKKDQYVMVRRFRRQTFFFYIFFLNEPVAGTLRHACKKFRANIRRSDRVGSLLSHAFIARS